ncbi:MAG: DUF2837 family protein [Planctomycetales bacterium]|nr:DUF2837 family protein [bacterium]UNM07627.1 MAG: DUF2837 family protein [Planctomycetales bacterium]
MITAGALLCIMSIVDTLAYSVRTAGVYAGRLATSLSLFNAVVIISRLSNMFQAPIIGNFADSVYQGDYTAHDVLNALRIDLLFIVLGVLVGASLSPSFIAIFKRGIVVMGERGTLPRTVTYGLLRISRLPGYLRRPNMASITRNISPGSIPKSILFWNVFITCFYSIGVMATALAGSFNHNLAATCANLSGIVNGIATMLLFILVDPPASLIIDDCISGKRPKEDAVRLNLHMIISRLAGCLLGILMLPIMARYVLYAATIVDKLF